MIATGSYYESRMKLYMKRWIGEALKGISQKTSYTACARLYFTPDPVFGESIHKKTKHPVIFRVLLI